MRRIALAALALAVMAKSAVCAGYSLLNVGIDYLNQERYSDAVIWLDKAIAAGDLNPDQLHIAYVDRGVAYSMQQQPDRAASDFTSALAIVPDDLQTVAKRASAYIEANQTDKAINDLSDLQKKRPHDVNIVFQRGLLDWEMDHYADAASAFSETFANGNHAYAWLWLQLARLKQGQDLGVYRSETQDIAGMHIKATMQQVWPMPLISFYGGGMDEAAVLTAVQKDGENEGQLCEANFYIAEWRKLHGDATGAKPLMEKAENDCPINYIERHMAKFELRKLS
jgi:lipoprotein NlpI